MPRKDKMIELNQIYNEDCLEGLNAPHEREVEMRDNLLMEVFPVGTKVIINMSGVSGEKT